jgi:hypothetical protein
MELNEKYPQIIYSNLIDPILSLPPEPKKNKVKPIIYPIILVALLFSICSISVSFIRFKDSVIEGVLGIIFSIVITNVPLKLHMTKKSVRETPNYLKLLVVFQSV